MRNAPDFMRVLLILVALSAPARHAVGADGAGRVQEGVRWAALDIPGSGRTGFELLSAEETGVAFTNSLADQQGATNRVLWNGSGLAAGDINGDGLADLLVCGLNRTNALYLNLGSWRFREVTHEAGLARPSRFDRGAVFADISGDGHLDVLIATTGGGVECFLNDGTGKFSDVSRRVGTVSGYGAMTLALADVNGDGFLDLYVCNYRADDLKDHGRLQLPVKDGRPVIPPELADRLVIQDGQLLQYGEPDVLYINNGRNGFLPVSWTNGNFLDEDGKAIDRPPLDWGLSASFRDINGDTFPDLYVCNDFWTPDRIWIGNGKDRFQAIDRLALRQISGSSMGVDFADLDRDGLMDFLVVEMLSRDLSRRKRQLLPTQLETMDVGAVTNRPQVLRNTLFRNRGDGTFAEIARFSGLEASDWSWSPVILDVDLDGYEDILITAGHVHDLLDADARDAIRARSARSGSTLQARLENDRLFPGLSQPIVAFRNMGEWRFEDTTALWGTDQLGVHHAMATADFDLDGDLDLAVNTLGSGVLLYRNTSSAPRVAVRLKGRLPNVQGIGAKVLLRGGAVPLQMQEVIAGGRYMAGSDPQLTFAAGQATGGMTIEVTWRSGRRSVVRDVRPNRIYEIDESAAIDVPSPENPPVTRPGLFRDVSAAMDHRHHDEAFDDFARQSMLHRKLSQLGPGIAWADLNQDGHDDLIIGSGRGGRTAVMLNDGKGRLTRANLRGLNIDASRDQTGIVSWTSDQGGARVLMGFSNYEDGRPDGPAVIACSLSDAATHDAVPASASSIGPLSLADIDGDGACELFVGGRVIPGKYPMAASSGLYRLEGGAWRRDTVMDRLLKDVGLVSASVWTDLEADGFPELVLACEWGSLRIFRNRGGHLDAWDPPVRMTSVRHSRADSTGKDPQTHKLSSLAGWWNSVTAGDFNNDGRMDLVAGNWGWNSEYRATADQPLRLYYGKFSAQEGLDLVETSWDSNLKSLTPIRRMSELALALPWLPARFPTHRAYSEATLAEVLGEHSQSAGHVSATILASMIFLNRGDHFEAIPLPDEAQMSAVFGISIADVDGDGYEDLFLAQNFFATRPEVARLDAGRGLLLIGDGTGRFRALNSKESGIAIDGEGRASAVADFNEDGRADLVVGQNGGRTRLFENVGAKPGLRVRLRGPARNRSGIGAVIRAGSGDAAGPAREIHAGAGYWSQDGSVQVLGFAKWPDFITVRWPGGRTSRVDLEPGKAMVEVVFDDTK